MTTSENSDSWRVLLPEGTPCDHSYWFDNDEGYILVSLQEVQP